MNPEEAVKRATEVIEAMPDAGEPELKAMLLERGIQPFMADQLVALVPLAFSRAWFDAAPMQKEYGDYFLARRP